MGFNSYIGIRTKLASLIASIFLLLGISIYISFDLILSEEFNSIERQSADANITRVKQAFSLLSDRLRRSTVADWAQWDPTYDYVIGKNAKFVENELYFDSLEVTGFGHFAVFDVQGVALTHGRIDRQLKEVTTLGQETLGQLLGTPAIHSFIHAPTQPGMSGLIKIDGAPHFFALGPIVPTSGIGAPVGTLFFTRPVDNTGISEVKDLTQLEISVTTNTHNTLPVMQSPNRSSISLVGDQVHSSLMLDDVDSQPLIGVTFHYTNQSLKQALRVRQLLMLAILIGLILGCISIAVALSALVLNPLRRMAIYLSGNSLQSIFEKRLDETRNDELGVLAQVFNSLIENLSQAYASLEQARSRAESANAAKSAFIAKVSHELRTPIHSITGMLRILLKEERSSAKRNYITMARNSANGLLETINEILDFSKSEAGKLTLEHIEFSIHDVIRDSVQTVGPRIEEKGALEAIVEVSQGIPDSLYGDPLRLRQVLVNLLGNATKFTKEGHLGLRAKTLTAEPNRATLEITVFDTGVGIPADRIGHIFEPFGQADESISRMFTGTGLGLTIVKQFVEAMGGHVKVESTLNKGSRFILTIPFDLPEHSQPLVYKPILSTPRVAVIDGNSVVAESLSQGLEDAGYIPDIIMSGQPAELDQFSQSLNQYGLVIVTSEALKRSRVFDLVVDLRGRESIPVVSILSPFEISVRERLVALDIPLVMTRPISLLDILGVIDGAISLNSESWDDAEDFSLHTSRPLEILIADDARTNQIILTELLRDAGHNVMCVDNGEDLVARVRDSMEQIPGMPKFDIVLTDVQMPLLDGLSATARIRAIERDSESKNHLPIVAVTAHAMTDEINRMRLFGVDDIATKPLDPIRLGEIIQRLTGKESASSPSEESRTNAPEPSADELCSSGLRLWTQMAQRSSDLGELFSLSDDPSSPEDFQRVLDIADVIERSGDSVRRTRLIFLSFLECFREQLHKLHDAKNTKQVHDLQFSSHALKGLLLDLGAKVSAGIASSIEQMCKDNEGEQAFLLVGKLIKQTLLVARLVEQLCDMVGPSEIADDKAPVLDMSELLNTED